MKKQKWIGFKKPKFIGIDFDCEGNPLIDWQETLKLKMDRQKKINDERRIAFDKKVKERNQKNNLVAELDTDE